VVEAVVAAGVEEAAALQRVEAAQVAAAQEVGFSSNSSPERQL
jgi:hypothetical protein